MTDHRNHWHSRLDALGAIASFACALHCLAIPVAMAAMPLAGFDLLHDHGFDQAFVLSAIVFGLLVIGSNCAPRAARAVAVMFGVGTLLLLLGAFVLHDGWVHVLALGLGGFLMGSAHLVNRRTAVRDRATVNGFRLLIASARAA
jgi:hypothetical protein